MQHAPSRFRGAARRAVTLTTLALCAGVVMPTLSATSTPASSSVTVDIARFAYAPKDLTVTPGTKVVWANKDETPHTIASNDKSFASKGLDTDDKFEHTFAAVGDFDYICTLHPFMTGTVHVRKP